MWYQLTIERTDSDARYSFEWRAWIQTEADDALDARGRAQTPGSALFQATSAIQADLVRRFKVGRQGNWRGRA